MPQLDTIRDAARAIRSFVMEREGTVPADLFDAIEVESLRPVPLAASNILERLYARRTEIDDDARTLAIDLTAFCIRNAQFGLDTSGRGLGIINALKRDMGQDVDQAAEDDPAPRPAFAAPSF